jgi:hypothetical protein
MRTAIRGSFDIEPIKNTFPMEFNITSLFVILGKRLVSRNWSLSRIAPLRKIDDFNWEWVYEQSKRNLSRSCFWWRTYRTPIKPAIHIRNISRIRRFLDGNEWKPWAIFVHLNGTWKCLLWGEAIQSHIGLHSRPSIAIVWRFSHRQIDFRI